MTLDNRDGNEGQILKRHSDGTVKLLNDVEPILFNFSGIRTNGNPQSPITVNTYKAVKIPYTFKILKVNLNSDVAGSIVIDIRKDTGEFPDSGDSICSATKPTLSSATAYSDSTLSGWTVDGNEDDYLAVNVDSNDGCKNVILEIIIAKI